MFIYHTTSWVTLFAPSLFQNPTFANTFWPGHFHLKIPNWDLIFISHFPSQFDFLHFRKHSILQVILSAVTLWTLGRCYHKKYRQSLVRFLLCCGHHLLLNIQYLFIASIHSSLPDLDDGHNFYRYWASNHHMYQLLGWSEEQSEHYNYFL